VYLANDVSQQSRARKKDEFPKAFAIVLPEAMEVAYRGTTGDVQGKLRRVVEVWKSRGVFPPGTITEIEARLEGIFPCRRR
jgi:regulator of Ty1 transposition protein 103